MKNNSKRSYLGLLITALLAAAVLAGCGSNKPAETAAETSAQAEAGGKARELLQEFESSAAAKAEEKTSEETTSEEPETIGTGEAAETEAEAPEESEAMKAEETEASAETAAPEAEPENFVDGIPFYAICQRENNKWDEVDGEYKQLSGTTYDCVCLTDEAAEAFPALDKALNAAAEDRIKRFEEEFKLLTGEAQSMVKDGYPLYAPLTMDGYVHVHRADAGIFSYLGASESYWGGVHGDYGYGGYTYDTQTGRELKLGDLVKDIPAMGELVIEKLQSDYDEQIFFESYEDTIREYFSGEESEDSPEVAFTVEPDGISFWFGPYDLAAYASGMQFVHICFDEAPELFDSRCTKNTQEEYAIEMADYLPLKVDLEQNGTVDEVLVWGDMNEYGEYDSLHVTVNGKDTEAENAYFYTMRPVYIRAQGHDILMVDTTTDNDYRIMYTFTLWDNGAVFDSEENNAFASQIPSRFGEDYDGFWRSLPVDPSNFCMWCRYDLLSTTSARRWYGIGPDEILEPKTEYYEIGNDYFVLTAKMDLVFDRVDASLDKVVEKDVTVPEGTELRFFRSDLETYTDMKDDAGNIYRVRMDDKDGWPPTIRGHEIMDCFDGIIFAG